MALELAALLPALAACGGSSTPSGSTRSSGSTGSATRSTRSGATQPAPSSGASGPNVVSASARGVSASMHPQSHHPLVNRPWPITFTVTEAGKPVRASVTYEYLFGGQVVARRSHYTFDGRFADVFRWPANAVGYPLTFRAVIEARGVTLNLDYPVQVIR
jgi:hypothetical protein